MPSHSVKQAKVMSAIAHGWHPSDLDIPVKVAKDFHAADAGHKYGKGMDKKAKAMRATKHYRRARGGSIEGDGKDDVSYGGTLPRSLQPMTTQIPDSWLRAPTPKYRYADGGDVDWSKLNQPFGELKGTAPEDTPVQFKTASPYVNITEGDIDRGMSIGMAAGPGVMVGPYGAHMLRAANRASVQPHPVIGEELKQRASGLRPEFQDIYKGAAQDMRDAEARANLEMRQGSLNPPVSDQDIWARSGWSRGSEGATKKEIPDIGAKLVPLKGTDRYLLQHPAGDFHEIYDVPPIKFNPNLKEGNGESYRYMTHPEHTEDVTRGLQWEDTNMMPRTYEKAGGGSVGNFNPERGSAFGLARQGMIKSIVPGRTDKLNLNVPSGSYIIPADIPSAIGQGNSTAGGAILDKMFNKGPYGMNLGRGKGGSRIGKRKSSLGFAKGGEVGQ